MFIRAEPQNPALFRMEGGKKANSDTVVTVRAYDSHITIKAETQEQAR